MLNKKCSWFVSLVFLLWLPSIAHATAGEVVGALFSGIDELVSFFLDFITGSAMTIVAGIAFFIMILGKVLMYIGLAFGPLLIALAPFRLTRNMALKWGEFMFGAMMYTGVATVVVMLCSSMFLKLKEFQTGVAAASATVGYVSPTLISLVSIMIALMAGFIMWRVPSITAELFGGMGLHTRAPKVSGKKGGDDKTQEKLDKIIESLKKPS